MKPILAFIIFFQFSYSVFAQTVTNKPDTSKTTRIIVYDSYQGHTKERSVLKNCFSINPLGILVGDFPLYYERNVVGKFNVQIGMGVTNKNYIYDLTDIEFDLSGNGNVSRFDDNLNRSAELGYSIMVQPKIYVNDVDFEGLYFGLEYRYRKYNYSSDMYSDTKLRSDIKESRSVADAKFNIGYSYNLGSNIIIDYYFGFGIRTSYYEYAVITPPYNSVSGMVETNMQTDRSSSPTASVGFRLGYAF